MAKKVNKTRQIPLKIRLEMTNNIDLYRKYIPNWDDLLLCEQTRCMKVNQLRVEGEGLNPVALPDWEI